MHERGHGSARFWYRGSYGEGKLAKGAIADQIVDLKVGFDMEIPFCRLANETQTWLKGFAFSPTLGFAYNY